MDYFLVHISMLMTLGLWPTVVKSLKAQIREVTAFTKQNVLVLNPNKCEILCWSKSENVCPPHTHIVALMETLFL